MESLLEFSGVTKRFAKKNALNNLSLSLETGLITGLCGPNGSGKTTLIKLAAGLLTPDGGDITALGEPIGIATKKFISYLPDRTLIPAYMQIPDMLRFYSDFFEDFSAERAKSMLNDLKIDTKEHFRTMSKGNQEKVQLALVMSRSAKLFLLDEPLGGIDPAAREHILKTIIRSYREDSTVLISTHLIADIESYLDDVIFINKGSVMLHEAADNLRSRTGKSIDGYFKEVFSEVSDND
jgi:ABC-2 type transport system ATP-binding protein